MARELTIQTDVVSYRREVERLARVTGRGLKDVMEESVSIMAGQLAKRFPPKTKGEGKRAIENDLNRIINSTMTKAELNNALDVTGDDRFDPEGIRIQDWHEQHRADNRRGHMRPRTIQGRERLSNGWMVGKKLYAPRSEVRKYARRRAQKVGDLKSHWLKATALYRGAGRVPAWVTKHGHNGIVRNRMKPNGDGYIEIVNPLAYSSNWRDTNNFVVKSQGRMLKNRIRGELRKQAREFNARKAA